MGVVVGGVIGGAWEYLGTNQCQGAWILVRVVSGAGKGCE